MLCVRNLADDMARYIHNECLLHKEQTRSNVVNRSEPELFFLILAHTVYKM